MVLRSHSLGYEASPCSGEDEDDEGCGNIFRDGQEEDEEENENEDKQEVQAKEENTGYSDTAHVIGDEGSEGGCEGEEGGGEKDKEGIEGEVTPDALPLATFDGLTNCSLLLTKSVH